MHRVVKRDLWGALVPVCEVITVSQGGRVSKLRRSDSERGRETGGEGERQAERERQVETKRERGRLRERNRGEGERWLISLLLVGRVSQGGRPCQVY